MAVETDQQLKTATSLEELDNITMLTIQPDNQFTTEGLKYLKEFPNLARIDLYHNRFENSDLEYFAELPTLQRLEFHEADYLTDDCLKILADAPRLKELKLAMDLDSEAVWNFLANKPDFVRLTYYHRENKPLVVTDNHLRQLKRKVAWSNSVRYKRFDISDEVVFQLSYLPSIQSLDFSQSTITDSGMQKIPYSISQQVTSLNLNGCLVTDAGLVEFADRWTDLKVLHLSDTAITDHSLREIGQLPQLQVLKLNNACITDAGLSHLRIATELYYLSLDDTNLTPLSGKILSELPGLRSLSLIKSNLNDEGVRFLSQCEHLSTLSLFLCPVSDQSIEYLVDSPAAITLRSLNLSATEVTGPGVSLLAQLPMLASLSLSYTTVDDSTLDVLESCEKLSSLDIRETNITPARIAAFKEKHPDMKISYSPKPVDRNPLPVE
ncbi:MAG: hypothetical protein R3C11_13350 [Planctomycetaceae bacterium]